MSLSVSDLTAIIQQRRTIKPADMAATGVSKADIELLLENAHWAPTHGMTEPWHFKVFQGTARQTLADALQKLYQNTTSPENFRPEKFEKLGKQPLLAPVVIAICMKRDPREKIHEFDELAAVACAVQNLHLTASAKGMAGFWSTPPLVFSEEMNALLHLEGNDRCLGLFYLGWPKEDLNWPSGKRSPLTEKIDWLG